MSGNVCQICLQSFDKKAGLAQHKKRKTPCKPPVINTIIQPITEPVLTNNLQNTAISLFSGCGGDTLGQERAGFKVIGFSELKKTFIKTHLENFPDSKPITDKGGKTSDITKIEDSQFLEYQGKADIVFAGFPCFTKGTLVLTNSGYKPIEDIKLEDTLLTHTGKFQKIINLQRKLYSNTIYDLRLKYHPNIVTATEEHPFYVRQKKSVWNNSFGKYDTSFDKAEWKHIKDITENDYFGMVINTNDIVPTFTFQSKVNKSRTDIETIKLDSENQWFMIGYFVGDGWIEDTKKLDGRNTNKIRFRINTTDVDTLIRIQTVLPITDKKCDTGKCKKFGCSDKKWHKILSSFGKYAHNKTIPEWVHDAPISLIQEFINGFMSVDGNIRKDGKHNMTTVSYNLAFSFQRLYLKLGHIFGIKRTKRPSAYVIEGRTVNQRDTYNICGLLSKDKQDQGSSFIEGNYVWFKSSSITKRLVRDEPVYNFEVDSDNSYIVENTVVHNCQGFSNAGKKQLTDPRNQMYLQFVRATKNIKPLFIIGENVQGLERMKSGPLDTDPMIIDKISAAFEEIGYSISHKIHEATTFGVPQKRKRVLIIGWDNSRIKKFSPAKFWQLVEANGRKNKMITMRTFVTNSMEGAYLLPESAIPEDFATYALAVKQDAQPTGTFHPYVKLKVDQNLLSCTKRESAIHSEIINLDSPSKTIICTYGHQPRLLVGLIKPDGTAYARILLPDELKQIQGFPADYKLTGTQSEKIIQVGNAVPPPMIEAVAKAIRDSV